MTFSLQNILTMAAAGILLLGGVFIRRFLLKIAWRFVRVALILLSLVLLAGLVFGFLEFGLR